MPAVRTFALTSGLAIIFDFLLQMTAFVALLSLDSKRQEASRPDVLCCFSSRNLPPPKQKEGLLLRFFRKIYAPFLLHRFIRPVVVCGLKGCSIFVPLWEGDQAEHGGKPPRLRADTWS